MVFPEFDTLTTQERDIKQGLKQGAILISQWPSAHLALFLTMELREIGDTRFRDSPNGFKETILSFTRVPTRANPEAQAGSLSPSKLMEH